MKKIILILSFAFISIFSSCSTSDKDYIETVKSITLDSGLTMEQVSQIYIDSGEFYVKNKDKKIKMEGSTFNLETMMGIWKNAMEMEKMFEAFDGQSSSKSQVYDEIKSHNIEVVRNSPMKWEIEGSTSNSKIIKVSSNNVYLKFPAYVDGDYIRVSADELELYFNSNKKFPKNTLNLSYAILDFLQKYE